MKTIEELQEIVANKNEELLKSYGVDVNTRYGDYTIKYSNPATIRACFEYGVNTATERGDYIAKNFTPEMIEELYNKEEMTLEEVCKELGREIKIIK